MSFGISDTDLSIAIRALNYRSLTEPIDYLQPRILIEISEKEGHFVILIENKEMRSLIGLEYSLS